MTAISLQLSLSTLYNLCPKSISFDFLIHFVLTELRLINIQALFNFIINDPTPTIEDGMQIATVRVMPLGGVPVTAPAIRRTAQHLVTAVALDGGIVSVLLAHIEQAIVLRCEDSDGTALDVTALQ